MAGTGSMLRCWLLAAGAACTLALAGLVLSYFLWARLDSAPAMPCVQGDDRWREAEAALRHAAALLSDEAPELELTPAHIFHLPLRHLCVARHGESLAALRARLDADWDCAPAWEHEVLANDAFLSLLAVTEEGAVVPVRLNRAGFDAAGELPERIAPTARLVLRKRPGGEQVLLRAPDPDPAPEAPAH